MKKSILLLAIFYTFCFQLSTFNCVAQAPGWQWAKSAGGPGVDESCQITTDVFGNVITTGDFGGQTCNFGSTVLTNNGYWNGMRVDFFIAKLTPSGDLIWATSAGGSHDDNCWGVTTDSHGNIYICGGFDSPTLTIGATTLINSGVTDIFIAKYDSAGNALWAKGFGGTGLENAFDLKCDRNDNLYFTGEFMSPSINFDNITLMNQGWEDIFIVKCDTMGAIIWAKQVGNTYSDKGLSIATTISGDFYLTGNFVSDSIFFDSNILVNDSITISNGFKSVFIARYDSLGNCIWARNFGGGLGDAGYVAADEVGNAYVTGAFWRDTINIGGIELLNADATQGADIFLAKFDLSGNVVWAKRVGNIINDASQDIVADGKGHVYITGFTNSSSIDFEGTILNNSGSFDIFLAKYDVAGNFIFAKNIGGSNEEYESAVCTDSSGNLYLSGMFYSPSIALDNIILTNHPICSDVFVARLGEYTGIDEYNNSSDFSVFPNPSPINITLIIPEKATIQILNLQGQLIQTLYAIENNTTIDISRFANGMYFVKVKTENEIIVKKFIKE
jgi:hypothetical protein